MKLNKSLIIAGIAGLAFTSCEKEINQNAELSILIAPNENVKFDGQTITVKRGAPMEFHFSGTSDVLTFFSGENGKKYQYKARTAVDEKEIESSKLEFTLAPQYGAPANILTMYISNNFPGLAKNNFEADSVLVEKHGWKELIAQAEFPQTVKAQSFSVDLKPYMGKRVAIAICYRGQNKALTQSRFAFNDFQIINKMNGGQQTSFTANSFGFTPLNMLDKKKLKDQTSMTSNRAYGTVNNNTSGIWNFSNVNAFFIHSSNAGTELKYSWLVSNLLVVNACTPDKGTGLKNITQSLDSYTYSYAQAGTYMATFIATCGNYNQESSVVREFTVVVTE